LLELLLIDERIKGALFDGLDLNGFWPGLPDLVCASQVCVQRCRDLGALATAAADEDQSSKTSRRRSTLQAARAGPGNLSKRSGLERLALNLRLPT
jgi:hypothetical protein